MFNALRTAASGMRAAQIGIQTAGHNLANINTEGYTRQRVEYETRIATSTFGVGNVGNGVNIAEISRTIDSFLDRRLRDQNSTLGYLQEQDKILDQVEGVFNELSDGDLSTAINDFFSALEDVSHDPEDNAIRSSFLAQADKLSQIFNGVGDQLTQIRANSNVSVEGMVDEVNRLSAEVADLNRQILSQEAQTTGRHANDLRDRRDQAIADIAELVQVTVIEQPSGVINLAINGSTLVSETRFNTLSTTQTVDGGVQIDTPIFESSTEPVILRDGRLAGVINARDNLVRSYMTDLDALAAGIIHEFNHLQATGRGLSTFENITGVETMQDSSDTLNAAGLDYPPIHGSFDVVVINKTTGEETNITIDVDLDGVGFDSSLDSVVLDMNAKFTAAGFTSFTASLDSLNRLEISNGGGNFTFAFANDSAHFTASLGLNTMFTGHNASDMAVNTLVSDTPALISAGTTAAPGDGSNAEAMLDLRQKLTLNSGTETFDEAYAALVGDIGIEKAKKGDMSEAQRVLIQSLQSARDDVSGVNVDEETIDMIQMQRAFQASARVATTVNQMLDELMNIV